MQVSIFVDRGRLKGICRNHCHMLLNYQKLTFLDVIYRRNIFQKISIDVHVIAVTLSLPHFILQGTSQLILLHFWTCSAISCFSYRTAWGFSPYSIRFIRLGCFVSCFSITSCKQQRYCSQAYVICGSSTCWQNTGSRNSSSVFIHNCWVLLRRCSRV